MTSPNFTRKYVVLATDSRTDAMTRKIAQAQLDAHTPPTPPGIHAGMRQSSEYQAYAAAMKRANRGRKAK